MELKRQVGTGPGAQPAIDTRPGPQPAGSRAVAGNWSRASRRELGVLAGYFLLAMAAADILNVRPGIEVMTGLVVLAALAITRRPAAFLRDWWFFLLGLVLWNLSGPIAAHSPFPLHLDFMWRLDRLMLFGRDPVVVVQQNLMHKGQVGPLDVLSVVLYNLHLPEPFIAGYFLWRLNRLVYLQFAASVLILLVLGFVTFIVFPAIPPWLAAIRYGRVPGIVNGFGPVLRAHPVPFHGTPIFYAFKLIGDPVAAFPSEHAALPLLEYIAFRRVLGRRAAWLLLWVFAVLFAVLYLGEHWLTDVLAGWLYAIAIFWGIRQLTERRRLSRGP